MIFLLPILFLAQVPVEDPQQLRAQVEAQVRMEMQLHAEQVAAARMYAEQSIAAAKLRATTQETTAEVQLDLQMAEEPAKVPLAKEPAKEEPAKDEPVKVPWYYAALTPIVALLARAWAHYGEMTRSSGSTVKTILRGIFGGRVVQ